jgi:hypothetical protein
MPIDADSFEVARGSALECGSIQDFLEACGVLAADENARSKAMLVRIVSMQTRLGQRSHGVGENAVRYDRSDAENDNDNDDSGEHAPA